MKKVLLLGMILWGGLCVAGQFPRTGVLPEQITTEDSVRIGIANMLSPCLGTGNMYPTFYDLSNNDHITFVFVAIGVNPCPDQPGFGLQYDIGTLPTGDYTMQVYTVGGPLDVPITIDDFLGFPLGEEVRFSVQGVAEAIPVPFMTGWVIGFLILTILLSAFVVRKKIVLLSILAILISANVSAKQTHNMDGMAAIYVNQAILYSDKELYSQAEQRLLLALDLPTMSKQHPRYGSILNTYAKVAANMNNLPLAIEKSQLAIEAYQISGNVRYEMHAKSRLAGLLIHSNEFNQAEQLIKEAMSYAKVINSPKAQARINLNLLSQLNEEQTDDEINQVLIEANLLMALFNKDIALSQQYLKSLLSSGFELIEVYQGDVARLLQQSATAELHYLEALMMANITGRYDLMVRVMNKLNDLYLNFNTHKLAENSQQTSKLKPFIYPYQKYQAIAANAAGNHISALSLMQELKLKAGGFWQQQDQQLLDDFKSNHPGSTL